MSWIFLLPQVHNGQYSIFFPKSEKSGENLGIMIPVDTPASPIAATSEFKPLQCFDFIIIYVVDVDFSGDIILVTFEADEASRVAQSEVTVFVNIIDDSINEADQVFVVELRMQENTSNVVFRNPFSLCKITDDDCKWSAPHAFFCLFA